MSFNGNIHSLLQMFAELDLQIIIKHFFAIFFLLKQFLVSNEVDSNSCIIHSLNTKLQ